MSAPSRAAEHAKIRAGVNVALDQAEMFRQIAGLVGVDLDAQPAGAVLRRVSEVVNAAEGDHESSALFLTYYDHSCALKKVSVILCDVGIPIDPGPYPLEMAVSDVVNLAANVVLSARALAHQRSSGGQNGN